jgi:branched-subunit amino acid aminotransferase/4-amino-4-deoxychorismate lyase
VAAKPGIFTTLRVRDGVVCFWRDHVARLRAGAEALDLAMPPEAALREEVAAAVDTLADARVRITLRPVGDPAVAARAYAAPRRPWRLRPVAVDPDRDQVRLKTTARQLYERARREAGDADEALLTAPDGAFLECTIANIFWLDRDGRLRTPPPTLPLLAGIARGRMLEAARGAGLEVVEVPVRAAEAAAARECFATNALFVAHPVAGIETVARYGGFTVARRLREAVIQAAPKTRIIR